MNLPPVRKSPGPLAWIPFRQVQYLAVRLKTRTPYLLFALLVAAFITFYPQLDAAGYCDGGCPEVSYPAHASGGAAVASGVSFVVAALVAVPGLLLSRVAGPTLPIPSPDVLFGIILSPETPPPRHPA